MTQSPIAATSPAAPDDAIVGAIRTVLTTQAARYYHIATWTIGLCVVTDFFVAVVWGLVTAAIASLRTLAEAKIRKSFAGEQNGRILALYPYLAAGVGCFWAGAPVLAWNSGHDFGAVIAIAMLFGGFMMVVTQFRAAPGAAMLVSAPYTAVFLYFLVGAIGQPTFWALAALAPIIFSAAGFAILFNWLFSRELARAKAERERSYAALSAAKEAELEAESARIAAEQASSAKSQFLATMSHELRTPLNAIIGYSELLMENAVEEGRASDSEDLARVLGASRRLLKMINEVLDFSKIEAGKLELELQHIDLPSTLSDIMDAVRPIAAAKGLALTLEGDLKRPMHSDAFRLGQCLLNLLSNAVKFTREGRVALKVAHETRNGADWIAFHVEDTGIGLTPCQMEKLFQPFVQADCSNTREFGGTGLGLALTRRIANALGGDVGVESALGQGSVFTLRLPARIESPHEAPMSGEGTAPIEAAA